MNSADVNQFVQLYSPQVGRGIDDGLLYYKSDYRRQRGAGLGSIFGAIARKLIPFAKNILWPAAKKYVVPHATTAAANLADDILAGKNVKQSIKDRSKGALQDVGSSALKGLRDELLGHSQTGTGRKRKQFKSLAKNRFRKSTKKVKRKKEAPIF